VDELLNAVGHKDHARAELSTAEVMTVALVAAEFFTGNQSLALRFLVEHAYIKPFSKSRFNRRLHALEDTLWQTVLAVLSQVHQQANAEDIFVVDTCPVPVCHNIRISRCRLYRGKQWRGYCASKRQFFFGLKLCLVVTQSGKPVEMTLSAGSTADICLLRRMALDLPEGSCLFGDSGFLDALLEQLLKEECALHLVAGRRKNSKVPLPGWLEYLRVQYRSQVETTYSQIAQRLARSIHAVTPRGFELKVFLTVLAFSMLG
jgi:Transposase DDE domain